MTPATNGAPPALDVELQNVLSLVIACALIAWCMRIYGLHKQLLEVQLALNKNHVAYVPNVGPSLHLLETMSMIHLQQFLRQQDQIASFKMSKLVAPFDIVSNSIKYTAGESSDVKGFSFDFQTSVPCSVQVYWGVSPSDATKFTKRPAHDTNPAVKSPSSRPASWFKSKKSAKTELQQQEQGLQELSPVLGSPLESPTDTDGSLATIETTERILFHCDEDGATVSKTYSVSHTLPPLPATSKAIVVLRTLLPSPSHPPPRVQVVIHKDKDTEDGGDQIQDTVTAQTIVLDLSSVSTTISSRTYTTEGGSSFAAHDVFGADEFVECSICLEDPTNVIILPCRHFCICETCLKEIDACPICRAKFASYVVHK